jgi:predicted XRE-type DNA-binding protein
MPRAVRARVSLLGMPYPDPIPALKQQLGAELAVLLEGWNADDVAELIGTDRPRISELRRGKLDRFSLETLIRYVSRLRRRVDLVIAPAASARRGTKNGP